MPRKPEADEELIVRDFPPETKAPASTALPLNDDGNARRFASMHRGRAYYCAALGGWLTWDGKRFVAIADDAGAYDLALKTARSIYNEAKYACDRDEEKLIGRWALESGNRTRIRAMLDLASRHPNIRRDVADFDTDQWLLNVENGILNLRDGSLLSHDPSYLITKLAPVFFDPDAKAVAFPAFLERIFGGDTELIEFVRVALGLVLSGDTSVQAMFVAHGKGANGKSTLMNAIRDLMGDYAVQLPADSLLKDNNLSGGRATPDIARLSGKRFIVASEADEDRKLGEAVVKALTGGDVIIARQLYKEFFEFKPVGKIWLTTNHKPIVSGMDECIWRRMKLIPFEVTIPEEERDPELGTKLRSELSAILNWLLEGSLYWHEHRQLPDCAAVSAASEEYRTESDPIAEFWAARISVDPAWEEFASEVFKSYRRYCDELGVPPVSQKSFGAAMAARPGVGRKKSSTMKYTGIRLK